MTIFPGKDFWGAFLKKVLSFVVSLKVIIILGTTALLLKNYISESIWRDVVVAITLGRVLVQSVYEFRNGTTVKEVNDNEHLSE